MQKTDLEVKPKRVKRPLEVTYRPGNASQHKVFEAWPNTQFLILRGQAGTGKTHAAAAHAILDLISGKIDKIMLTRSAVGPGRKVGFLPGGIEEKLGSWMGPMRDVLSEMTFTKLEGIRTEMVLMEQIRGRNIKKAVMLVDEAQNLEDEELKALATRICDTGMLVLCGDTSQTDIKTVSNPFARFCNKVANIKGITQINFTKEDNMRAPIINEILDALS